MQDAQGLVPEQKWHISVSLGPICLKLPSQALVFPQYPPTHTYTHKLTHTTPKSFRLKGIVGLTGFRPLATEAGKTSKQAVVMSER